MLKNFMGKPAVHRESLWQSRRQDSGLRDAGGLREVLRGILGRTGLLQAVHGPPALHRGQDYSKEPQRMVVDISALCLRHVGYGIPSDLFGACVTGCVDSQTTDCRGGFQVALEPHLAEGFSRISMAVSPTRLGAS